MGITAVDDLLREYVECSDADRAEAMLGELVVEHAQPGIRKVVRYKLAFQGQWEAQDVEDVAGEVVLELIGRLRSMRGGGPAEVIGSFAGYTAVAAYHACNEYLRRKYPNRHRLKPVPLSADHGKKFAVWENASEWVCNSPVGGGERPDGIPEACRWRDLLAESPRANATTL